MTSIPLSYLYPLSYQVGIPLLLALLLSVTFRLITTAAASAKISKETQPNLTTFHAFAIEGLQLILAACAIYQLCGITSSFLASPLHSMGLLLLSGLLYSTAIFAVDFIETLIVLGTLSHPDQLQTFVLTRQEVWPWLIRLLTTAGITVARLTFCKKEGMVIMARRTKDLKQVKKAVLLRRRERRVSGSAASTPAPSILWTSTGMTVRRHSFPDHQLNTRPIISDSRVLPAVDTATTSNPDDESPRGRATTAPETPGQGTRGDSGSQVRRIIDRIERSSSSRGSSSGSEDSTVRRFIGRIDERQSCSRASSTKSHGARKRWRPAGGTVKL